jgi:hypothetical protein
VAGPVLRGDTVRWDDVGTIPFDALGAPGWHPRPNSARAGAAQPPQTAVHAAGPDGQGKERHGS